MRGGIERNVGEQPVGRVMAEHGLKRHDLVVASTEQITHKMVSRACKGRRSTRNVQYKILNAVNSATGKDYSIGDIFDY